MRAARRTGGLQRKFFVALLIVGIVPGMVALWATYRSSTASLKQAIGEGFQEIARSTAIRLATAVDDEIDHAARLAISIADQQAESLGKQADRSPKKTGRSQSGHQPGSGNVTARYLEEWARESRQYLRVTVADRHGLVIATQTEIP